MQQPALACVGLLAALPVLSAFASAQTAPTNLSLSVLAGRMVYDEARDQLLFFGPNLPAPVHAWDGTRWGRVLPDVNVGARFAAWFPPLQKVILQNGIDIVAWDGDGLEPVTTMPSDGRLAVDRNSGALYLLGNSSTWRFTLAGGWQSLPPIPATTIAPILGASFDQARDRLVAVTLAIQPLGFETWEWDGANWSMQNSRPTAIGAIVYDPALNRVVAPAIDETFEWDGSNWNLVRQPGARRFQAYAADHENGRLFGSFFVTRGLAVWDGAAWSSIRRPHFDEAYQSASYDSNRNRVVAFGADLARSQSNAAEWDGVRWNYTANVPVPLRQDHAQAYDAARQQTVLFGGRWQGQDLGDTWLWDGAAWQQANPTGPTPSPRSSPALAYDSGRQRVLLIGGNDSGGYINDHWEWDGTNWALISSATPMTIAAGKAAYDPIRARTVFFAMTNTFEYDGTSWQAGINTVLRAERNSSFAFNAITQRVEGDLRGINTGLVRRYSWDGSVWTAIGDPIGHHVFDGARGFMLGLSEERLVADTQQSADAVHAGSNCGGQTIVSSITTFGAPRPGNADLQLQVRAEATQRPAMIAFGTGQTQIPLGNGCELAIHSPIASRVWFTNASGIVRVPLPLPSAASLSGFTFVAQGAVLDPASTGGIALTRGLVVTVGN